MKRQLLGFALVCFVALAIVGSARGDDPKDSPVPLPTFDLRFRNYGLYQNDTDFDRTKPLYNKFGQAEGYFATTLEPGVTWTPIPQATVRYLGKFGENVWSRNNAEELTPTASDMTIVQTQELWGEVRLPGTVTVHAGYDFMHDPTRLFLDRHIGAAAVTAGPNDWRITALVGQLPNSPTKGTTTPLNFSDLAQNTFANTAMIYALRADVAARTWRVIPAIYGLNDRTDANREKNLLNPCAHVDGPLADKLTMQIDAAVQWGVYRHGGIADKDVDILGYAGQVNLDLDSRPVRVRFNAFVFSGNNNGPNSLNDGSYTYSGWSRSDTSFLTENKWQDQYNNLDEYAAAQRAGMALADVRIGGFPIESLEIFAVGGHGRAMAAEQLDPRDPTIGTEVDVGATWMPYGPHVALTLAAVGVWPGKSGAMLINQIKMTACRPIYNGQALMDIKF